MALLDGKESAFRLGGVQERLFPDGLLNLNARTLLTSDRPAVIACIRDAWRCLNVKTNRAAVTLPDTIGRMMVVELDERLKNRTEGRELVRWKLQRKLSIDLSDMQLDYQVLEERENGELAVLAVFVAREIVMQTEMLLQEAGIDPVRIEFTCMSLYRSLAGRLDQHGTGGLVCYHGGRLGIMFMHNGIPNYVRSKELEGCPTNDPRVCMDLKNTLVAWRERTKQPGIGTIHTLAPPTISERFASMVAEASGIRPVLLSMADFLPTRDTDMTDRASFYPYAAAIGAALRPV